MGVGRIDGRERGRWMQVAALVLVGGCNVVSPGNGSPAGTDGWRPGSTTDHSDHGDDAGASDDEATDDGHDDDDAGATTGQDESGDGGDDSVVLDVGAGDDGDPTPREPVCHVEDGELSGVGPCIDTAPPGSFEPEVQWTFYGPSGYDDAIPTPLVANLTDDDGNGVIDLCDVPDVIVVASGLGEAGPGHIFILDGETGEVQVEIEHDVQGGGTPAIGDIDHDGVPEIVAVEPHQSRQLVAFEADGTLIWTSTDAWEHSINSAIALADLDADGEIEVLAGSRVYSAVDGSLKFHDARDRNYSATTAADLDADGQLEVILPFAALRADGSLYYDRHELYATPDYASGHAQVADFDGDGDPEVLVDQNAGIWMLDHEGNVLWSEFRPTGERYDWNRPVNIHDFDGDGRPEFALSSENHYGVYELDRSQLWVSEISDQSGNAGGTAFDFLGSGRAQAIYADESANWVFDDVGGTLMSTPRWHGTLIEYPVVADIDNDGSAEIVVPGYMQPISGGREPRFTVQAIRDAEDRWIPARRIWNQHTYHVTNVREDGTIPQVETPSWQALNTFRTQAQIAGGRVCAPRPAG